MSPITYIGDEGYSEGVFEDALAKLLKLLSIEDLQTKTGESGKETTLQYQICEALLKAYIAEPRFVYSIGSKVAIGEMSIQLVSRWKNSAVTDPKTAGAAKKEVENILKDINIEPTPYENPRKRTILDLAKQWGCEWAEIEHVDIEALLSTLDDYRSKNPLKVLKKDDSKNADSKSNK